MKKSALLGATAAGLLALAGMAQAQDTSAISFGAGAGARNVGVLDAADDLELEGPQAIYAGDSGEIFLLDQVNSRILKFDPRDPDKQTQALDLPEGVTPTDMVVSGNDIHVWDGKPITLQATGREDAPTRGLSVTRSSEPPDDATKTAFAAMGSMEVDESYDPEAGQTRSLGAPGRSKQTVASRGRGQVVASFAPLAGDSGVKISIAPKAGGSPLAGLELQVRSKLGAVDLLEIDRQGRFYVFAEDVPTMGGQPTTFVVRYAANGALEGVYELPLNSTSGLSRRFVAVTPDGEVYFLRNKKGASDVLAVGFRQIRKGKIIDLGGGGGISFADLAKIKGAAAAVRPLTRAQVVQNGFAFANVRWRVKPSAYGRDPDTSCSGFSRIRRPGYMSGKVNQEVVGIPYCWGCHGSLAQIAAMIERGMLAGNVCTRNDPRRDVAGVDCSAFVSAAWGLQTHFTTIAIPSITRQLPSAWDMRPGDAFNKPGSHVMLFVRFTPDKKAEVIEASPGACNGKVCRNVYPVGSLIGRGYAPVRYRAVLEDAPVASNTAAPAPKTR